MYYRQALPQHGEPSDGKIDDMRECKHYGLKSTRKPKAHNLLSSTVAVIDQDQRPGYAYVTFADSFVAAVGKIMPYGISIWHPVFLCVAFNTHKGLWTINAAYLNDTNTVRQLWTSAEKPDWLTIFKSRSKPNGETSRA